MTRSKPYQALDKLLRERRSNDDMLATIFGYKLGIQAGEHADRSAVIVCVSLLEQALEDAIWSHCIADVDDEKEAFFTGQGDRPGIVSSLAGKASLAYILGVIGPKARQDISRIRRIRNAFAHSKRHIDFNSKEVQDNCVFNVTQTDWWKHIIGKALLTHRETFLEVVEMLAFSLTNVDESGPRPKNYKRDSFGQIFS